MRNFGGLVLTLSLLAGCTTSASSSSGEAGRSSGSQSPPATSPALPVRTLSSATIDSRGRVIHSYSGSPKVFAAKVSSVWSGL